MHDRVDAVALTVTIDRCLDYSMDGRLTEPERMQFLIAAKRLRGALLNLLSARFDEGTPALSSANAELRRVSTALKKETAVIENAARTLAELTALVAALDRLLGVAVGFL